MNNKEYCHKNNVILIKGGKSYFDLLTNLIDEAKETIFIQSYIFNEDDTGIHIAKSLRKAAKRNVKTYVLVDGIASQSLSKNFIQSLLNDGINFKPFMPLFQCNDYYFGRRMHQKVVCIDQVHSLVGGLNIADRYNDLPNKTAWLDFAVYVQGEVSVNVADYCRRIWNGYPYDDEKYNFENLTTNINLNSDEFCDVRMRRNDWVWHKNEISNSYIEMMHHAKNNITILCSYFIPGKTLRRLMANAVKRGISIKVITTNKSDVKIAKYAERWLYDWLLRNKIELYEYKTRILHGKLAICDDDWFTIGSYNINNISTYAALELNLDIKNKNKTIELLQFVNEIINVDCIKITKEYHRNSKNIIKQFSRWLSYQFIRIVFKLFTFYFKRKN